MCLNIVGSTLTNKLASVDSNMLSFCYQVSQISIADAFLLWICPQWVLKDFENESEICFSLLLFSSINNLNTS